MPKSCFKTMRYLIILLLFINCNKAMTQENIYQFSVKNIKNERVSLKQYEGKVLLIVNTASECGFTPQYAELEELAQTYRSKGFEILAFPCNDFGGQEPLNGQEIQSFCDLRFKTSFPIFDKVAIKSPNTSDLYKFLSDKSRNGCTSIAPKWNFHKYLINREGKVVDYFLSITKPNSSKVKKALEKLL
jgi:glutathione peroxidase